MKNKKGSSFLFTNALVVMMFCIIIGFTTMVQAGVKDFQDTLYESYYQGAVPEPQNVDEALQIILPVEGKENLESLIQGRGPFTTDTSGYGNWYVTFSYNKTPQGYPDPTKGDIICYFELFKDGQTLKPLYVSKESWKEIKPGYYISTVSFSTMDILLTLEHFGNDPTEWNIRGNITLK